MSIAKQFNIAKQEVWEAWKCVRANRGAAGVDNQCIEAFEGNLKDNLYKIWNRMSAGAYFPPAVLGVAIPKKSGGQRILGIPTISDRVAQTVVKRRLEQVLEPIFLPDSYGYRPGKSAIDAVAVTRQRCWKQDWVLEFDIRGLFDNIRHDLLLKAVKKHVSENWILLYVERWLRAPMQGLDGVITSRSIGTPQGGCVSPVLSNLFLHYVFDAWMTRNFPTLKWCRFADDGLVHCKSKQQAENMLRALSQRFKSCGLELHPGKTHIVYCSDSNRKANHDVREFTFLGYTFRRRRCKNKKTGELFDAFQPAVSKDAIKSMNREMKYRWKVKSKTHLSLKVLAYRMNPVIRGWTNYYGHFCPEQLVCVARYINEQVRIWAINRYPHLADHRWRSYDWLRKVYRGSPRLFAHWQMYPVY